MARLARAVPRSKGGTRPAGARDAALLGRLLGELVAAVEGEALPPDRARRLASHGFADDPRVAAVIAEMGSETAGYALFWPVYDTEIGGQVMFLSDLLAGDPWRGTGLAEDLIAAVARRTVAAGAQPAWRRIVSRRRM